VQAEKCSEPFIAVAAELLLMREMNPPVLHDRTPMLIASITLRPVSIAPLVASAVTLIAIVRLFPKTDLKIFVAV
jgi:hypothetical protein